MGAAMAPAAYDTLWAYFADTHTGPADYDAIFTGDLGELGHEIVMDLFQQDSVDMTRNYEDCGMLLYDRDHRICTLVVPAAAAPRRYSTAIFSPA